ncbi:hypothetical protein ACFQ3F_18460 [Nocardioides ginsengisoli]|uniref:Uncharacterized protein n=1 Tax=Nocardioides ginsengisoli TaxID=363868 RepID=A0ABW3W5J3_9ACTN
MALRRLRRKVRCWLKHGPRGCPHIERHSRRRPRPGSPAAPVAPASEPATLTHPLRLPASPLGRHQRD